MLDPMNRIQRWVLGLFVYFGFIKLVGVSLEVSK